MHHYTLLQLVIYPRKISKKIVMQMIISNVPALDLSYATMEVRLPLKLYSNGIIPLQGIFCFNQLGVSTKVSECERKALTRHV